jgi:Na+/H+ antiporter NhaD/arsenite permease-like protein
MPGPETQHGRKESMMKMLKTPSPLLIILFALATPLPVLAATDTSINLTASWPGIVSLVLFLVAYLLVISEELIHLRKSVPVMIAAGIIWVLVAIAHAQVGNTEHLEAVFTHDLLEFGQLFLFLLAAMTFINTMDERGIFNMIRVKLLSSGLSLRAIYWTTGLLAFCISPVADNLTTALLMTAVVLKVAPDDHKFITVSCINVVIAANAGGAFSPFGDITTLMVWQSGVLQFGEFFALFIPSLVNWLVPATIMSLTVKTSRPTAINETARVEYGGWVVVGLFILTLVMAVLSHNLLHLPPVLGMMTGLGILKVYGFYLKQHGEKYTGAPPGISGDLALRLAAAQPRPYDMYQNLEKAEWDTLMFFYGVIMCVGGLGSFGYLAVGSEWIYGGLGHTTANVLIGIASAIIDNIPVMFAVLEMNPQMSPGQWLLVTLTAGVGGSMLSIGSAAGVAVMGQARGVYTFFGHLKWTWAIALGYAASIATHLWLNADKFT